MIFPFYLIFNVWQYFDYKFKETIWELPKDGIYSYYHPDILLNTPQGIFVLNKKEGSIFHFDDSGKAFSHFGRPGNGPGEINRMVVNLQFEDQELMLLHQNGRIDVFSLDGEFQKSINLNPIGARLLYREGENEFFLSRIDGKRSIVWTKKGVELLREPIVEHPSLDKVNEIHQMKGGDFLFFCNQNSVLGEVHFIVFQLKENEIWDRGNFKSSVFKIIKPVAPDNLPQNATFYHRVLVGFTVSDRLGFVLTNDSRGKLEHPKKGKYEILETYHPERREWAGMKIFSPSDKSFSYFQHLSENDWIVFDREKGVFARIETSEVD